LLTRLHVLTRADCTTRNKARARRLQRAYDDLERRIKTLSAQEELDKIRPDLNGTQIMEVLGIPPGRLVGQARRFLLELRMEHGPLGHDRAVQALLRWAGAKGLDVPGPPDTAARRGLTARDPVARRREPADDPQVCPYPATNPGPREADGLTCLSCISPPGDALVLMPGDGVTAPGRPGR
jgi:hypothetical protein